jgi:hypothetical protein
MFRQEACSEDRSNRANRPSSELPRTLGVGNLEQIEKRAYEIYEERNQEDGHALDDWLRAEGEIGNHLSQIPHSK